MTTCLWQVDHVRLTRLTLDGALRTARELDLSAAVLRQLEVAIARVNATPAVLAATEQLLPELLAGSSEEALAQAAALQLEAAWGELSSGYYLLLALLQIPAARQRHADRGVGERVSRDTLREVAIWCRDLARFGEAGIPHEILAWLQHSLRGELLRVGNNQFAPVPFRGPLIALRQRRTGRLCCLSTEGRTVSATSQRGRRIDDRAGVILDEIVELPDEDWEVVLEPGDALLELHTPADAHLGPEHSLPSVREAFALFSRLSPDHRPRGIWGKGWVLDPQVRQLLPGSDGIRWFQEAGHLFPWAIPEERTVRRFFGSSTRRADLATLPRAGMNPFQVRLADHLARPENTLPGRGAFLLVDELETLWTRLAAGAVGR